MEGNLILIRSNTFLARQIRKVSNSNYEHVAIFIEDDKLIEASWSGVVITDFAKYQKAKENNKTEFDICKLKKSLTPDEWQRVKKYLLDKIGKKYDILQFLSLFFFFIFNINRKTNPIDIESKFICSELIGKAFSKINIYFNTQIDLDNLTPKDIEISPIIERVI